MEVQLRLHLASSMVIKLINPYQLAYQPLNYGDMSCLIFQEGWKMQHVKELLQAKTFERYPLVI